MVLTGSGNLLIVLSPFLQNFPRPSYRAGVFVYLAQGGFTPPTF